MGILPLKTNQGLLDTDADKANVLNDYFSSVFTREIMNHFTCLVTNTQIYHPSRLLPWSC